MAAPDGIRHSTRAEDDRQSLDPCHSVRPVTGLERRRSCGHPAQALSQLARGHCKPAAIGRVGADSSCTWAFSAHCFPNRLMNTGPWQRPALAGQYVGVQKPAVFCTLMASADSQKGWCFKNGRSGTSKGPGMTMASFRAVYDDPMPRAVFLGQLRVEHCWPYGRHRTASRVGTAPGCIWSSVA